MSVLCVFFFLMRRPPPISTRTDTLFPYMTLFRSESQHPLAERGAGLDVGEVRGMEFGVLGTVDPLLDKVPARRWRHGIFGAGDHQRSEEHTSELQSLMRISYAVFCSKKKK